MELVMKDAKSALEVSETTFGRNSTKLWFTRSSLHMPQVPVRVLARS